MRLLVCGGREYTNKAKVFQTLDRVNAKRAISILIHGDCKAGADQLAQQWAEQNNVHTARVTALWDQLGHAAGPVRNVIMGHVLRPEGVLAFPGGKGTANMVKVARALDIPVMEVQ